MQGVKLVKPSSLIQPKISFTASGTDLITILRGALSFKTVVIPQNSFGFQDKIFPATKLPSESCTLTQLAAWSHSDSAVLLMPPAVDLEHSEHSLKLSLLNIVQT